MFRKSLSCILLGFCISILVGCASTRAVLPPKAKTGLSQISTALAEGRAQLQAAVATLKTLDKVGTVVPSAVRDYSSQVVMLNQTVESTRRRLATAERPDEFFSNWKSDLDSISDTELREAGEKRYAAARHELERLKKEIDRLRDAFRPFHTQLNDVETYLRNDPTNTGVEQVRPKIRQIVRTEKDVLKKVDAVQDGITQLMR